MKEYQRKRARQETGWWWWGARLQLPHGAMSLNLSHHELHFDSVSANMSNQGVCKPALYDSHTDLKPLRTLLDQSKPIKCS